MALAAPILVLKLSRLEDRLEIRVPDSAYKSPLNEAFAILGESENPEWKGDRVQTGQYNDETDDVERTPDLTVYVPKKELESRVNQTVTLHYQIEGETDPQTSASVTLRIEP